MKPMIVSSLYHPNVFGGAEKIAQVLAEGLQAAGHEPVVVTTDGGAGTRTGQVNGVRVHYVGGKNLYWPPTATKAQRMLRPLWHGINSYNPWMSREVGRLLDAERPDVVNTHSLTGLSCLVWREVKQRQLPLVHTLHDYALLCPKCSMYAGGANCASRCTGCRAFTHPNKGLSAHVDRVVGVSRFTLERHLDNGFFPQAGSHRVIYNGLPEPERLATQPGQAQDALRLGFVGRLVPNKGIAQLVAQMDAWTPAQCRLTVAGRGTPEFERSLRARARDNVEFVGFIDPRELYRRIDVLVVPSLYHDPLPTTVIEAYQHGVPVIAARSGGLPELVEEGCTGLLFDPAQPDGLRAAISAFLGDPGLAARMRPRVIEKARAYTLERMRSEYVELLVQAAQPAA